MAKRKAKVAAVPVIPPVTALIPRRYSVKQLAAVYAWCKANPGGEVRINEYGGERMTAAEWLRWFRGKLDEKITSRIPGPTHRGVRGAVWLGRNKAAAKSAAPGRKLGHDYEIELIRAARYNGNRVMVEPSACDWNTLGPRVKAALEPRFRDPAGY